MDNPIRPPEEILAYRSLRRILAAKPEKLPNPWIELLPLVDARSM